MFSGFRKAPSTESSDFTSEFVDAEVTGEQTLGTLLQAGIGFAGEIATFGGRGFSKT